MNNLFLEGPIQTGKSTLIRYCLHKVYGPDLDGAAAKNFNGAATNSSNGAVAKNLPGDTAGGSCTANSSKAVGGFTVQRMHFPTPGNDKRFGFRLMPAAAPIKAHTCVTATDDDLMASDGMFKLVGCMDKGKNASRSSSRVNLDVFESKGVELLQQAENDAESGRINLVLLDEIGGHELICEQFMTLLNELLCSDIPCLGVIKQYENAFRMNPAIARANQELHQRITGPNGEHGKILYYQRGDEQIRKALDEFIENLTK